MNQNWAYVAGFVDANGSFIVRGKYTTKRGTVCPNMSMLAISHSNLDFILRLQKELGAGSIGKNPNANNHRKPAYCLKLSSKQVRRIVPLILPYLRVKTKQAKIALLAAKLLENNRGGHKEHTTNNEAIKVYAQQVRALNSRKGNRTRSV